MNSFNYKRRKSSVVQIGNTPMGGDFPIRLQSMTNTSTMDTEASIEQCIRIINAGGEYVRLTAQGVREAENLKQIKEGLRNRGYTTPLIADIHFNPKAADAAAQIVEKVRINPGNFVDPVKTFETFEYTDEEYRKEIEKIKERFIPFLNICKQHNTAIRIGVNHGSLSDRIMSRYGDTPEGMVESCMEFLRICIEQQFPNVVISIKASNTSVMIRTVRLLVNRMEEEKMTFPLHLGVTEAGDGEDGRIKSAVGIGTLLAEGTGDTIRVSLSEDPEHEIPVAKLLVNYIAEKENHPLIPETVFSGYNPIYPERRNTINIQGIGGGNVPVVMGTGYRVQGAGYKEGLSPDVIYCGDKMPEELYIGKKYIVNGSHWKEKENVFPLFSMAEFEMWKQHSSLKFLHLSYPELNQPVLSNLKKDTHTIIVLTTSHKHGTGEQLAFIHKLMDEKIDLPVIIAKTYNEEDITTLQVKSGTDFGPFFIDMLVDGIWLQNKGNIAPEILDSCAFGILQATGRRISKTEYISCPGCGRTLFHLQATIQKVKAATAHLKGLKIGIMGCIVNGPGEMADADYGYVGAGPGKISLYKGKQCIEKNIPEEKAVESLIQLIKKYGDWRDLE